MRFERAALLLTLVLSVETARAQDSDAFLAQQRYDSGVAAYEAGQHAEALEHFRASFAMSRSPNARLMVARTLRNLGRAAEALEQFELTEREAAARARTEARFGSTRDAAASAASELRRQVGTVRLVMGSPPEGLSLRLGERDIPAEALGVAIPVDPGVIVVIATAPGHAERVEERSVAAGEEVEIVLALEPEVPVAEPPPEARAAPPVRAASRDAVLDGLGVALGILGAGGLGAGVALTVAAQSRYDGLLAQCGQLPCPPSLAGAVAEGRAFEAGAYASYAIGGALVASAILLFALADGATSEAAQHALRDGVLLRW